jgi:ABC-type branched-subunit amino acid transport system substrate-binding protein
MGVSSAIMHINARGGVLGRMLGYKVYRDGIKFDIGHPYSDCAVPASDVYEDKGVLMIDPAATSP